jgi:hypothetical protein
MKYLPGLLLTLNVCRRVTLQLKYDKCVGYWGMPMNSVLQVQHCCRHTLPEIAFSRKQTSDTAAWPPAPSCDPQAPSTQLPRFRGQQLWSWCFLCWGSEQQCWCLLGVPTHGPFHSAKQFQFNSVSSPYSLFAYTYLSLSKTIILDTVHFLGFFSKQNILEMWCFHHQTQGSWEIVILVMLASILPIF